MGKLNRRTKHAATDMLSSLLTSKMLVPMRSSKEFRQFAFECAKQAAETKNERLRATLLETSRLWMETALALERSWAVAEDGPPGGEG